MRELLIITKKTYLRLDIVQVGSVWKQERHTRLHVSTKKPFVGSRQQEHKRVASSETTFDTDEQIRVFGSAT